MAGLSDPSTKVTHGTQVRNMWPFGSLVYHLFIFKSSYLPIVIIFRFFIGPFRVKGTATPMAHIDPVFNLRFWRIWG